MTEKASITQIVSNREWCDLLVQALDTEDTLRPFTVKETALIDETRNLYLATSTENPIEGWDFTAAVLGFTLLARELEAGLSEQSRFILDSFYSDMNSSIDHPTEGLQGLDGRDKI